MLSFATVFEYSVIRILRLRPSAMHTGSNVYKVKLEQGTELYISDYIIMPNL